MCVWFEGRLLDIVSKLCTYTSDRSIVQRLTKKKDRKINTFYYPYIVQTKY